VTEFHSLLRDLILMVFFLLVVLSGYWLVKALKG
jgi:hypothetical protein